MVITRAHKLVDRVYGQNETVENKTLFKLYFIKKMNVYPTVIV